MNSKQRRKARRRAERAVAWLFDGVPFSGEFVGARYDTPVELWNPTVRRVGEALDVGRVLADFSAKVRARAGT